MSHRARSTAPGALANGSAGLLPSPTLSECRHRSLARCFVAVDRRAVFVVAIAQRPHPRGAYGRGCGFHDAADNSAIGKHVVVVLAPLAEHAGSRGALED